MVSNRSANRRECRRGSTDAAAVLKRGFIAEGFDVLWREHGDLAEKSIMVVSGGADYLRLRINWCSRRSNSAKDWDFDR
jgi:hypothetical protein